MQVRDVMSPVSGSISVNDRLRDASTRMKSLGLDPLPVTDDHRVVGTLSNASLMRWIAQEGIAGGMTRVRDVMSTDVVCCYEDQDAGEAVQAVGTAASRAGMDRVPVLDRGGNLVGIASLHSLATSSDGMDEGITAMERVNSVDQFTQFDNDRVDYMSDQSFPASDPPSSATGSTPAPAGEGDPS